MWTDLESKIVSLIQVIKGYEALVERLATENECLYVTVLELRILVEEIKIEKDIPLPSGIRTKYPFEKMEIGDSFLVKKNPATSMRSYQKSKDGKIKLICKKYEEGYRVWRVK